MFYFFNKQNAFFNIATSSLIKKARVYPHLTKAAWGILSVILYIIKESSNPVEEFMIRSKAFKISGFVVKLLSFS